MEKKLKILLVEDNLIEVMKMKRTISFLKLDHILHEAKNGEEALILLEEDRTNLPDIILLDLNMPKIKGSHTAMKSGMIAAETIFENIKENKDLSIYEDKFKKSWVYEELHSARNVKPSFSWGLILGIIFTGIDQILFRGKLPFTLKHKHADHETLKPANEMPKIDYPKPDNVITFDKTSSVYLNNKALPSTSYWSIKDLDTEEIVVDYDTTYTKISCDNNSNYFDVYMNGLEPERYYKILIKSIFANKEVVVFDKDYIFKVIR